ncbi:MAG: MauE/DoxX family redox-associated membrane protein [Desulfobacterales bacterium]
MPVLGREPGTVYYRTADLIEAVAGTALSNMLSNHLPSDYRKWPVLGLRIFLGGVFVWAGWVKIDDPQGFAAIIGNYQLLPGPLVNPLAVLLPWLEVLCGVLLVTGAWVDGSLLIVNALMVVFMAALVSTWIRGIDVDCGCFSVETTENGADYLTDILRDAVLLAIGLWLSFDQTKRNHIREN